MKKSELREIIKEELTKAELKIKTKKGYAFADKLYNRAKKEWKDGLDQFEFADKYRHKLDDFLLNKIELYTWSRDPNIEIAYAIEAHLIEKLSKLLGTTPEQLL